MKIEDLNIDTKNAIKNNIASEDNITKQHKSDTRKPKLMLKHLNKLRKMRELNALEKLYQDEQLGIIFSNPVEPPL